MNNDLEMYKILKKKYDKFVETTKFIEDEKKSMLNKLDELTKKLNKYKIDTRTIFYIRDHYDSTSALRLIQIDSGQYKLFDISSDGLSRDDNRYTDQIIHFNQMDLPTMDRIMSENGMTLIGLGRLIGIKYEINSDITS